MAKKQTTLAPVRIAAQEMRMVSIDELVPYARNAKRHSKAQLAQLRASLREFGFVAPVMIDEDKNVIAGHGRLEAARAEGMREVPCVLASGLSDAQRRAYIIADNRLTELGEWDMDALRFEMSELSELHFDTSVTGFEISEIGIAGEAGILSKPIEDNYDAAPPSETIVHRGDIFELGSHRLMCGDTASADDMGKLMNGALANMVFTDPPYGVAVGTRNRELNAHGLSYSCEDDIYGDAMGEDELRDMLLAAMKNIREACRDDASYYVTSPQGGSLGLMMMMMMRDAGLLVRHVLIWKKSSPTFTMGRLNYEYQHEPIFYTWTKRHVWYGKGTFHSSVWEVAKPRKCDLHPTMKPVELVANAILNSSETEDLVLDGFGGSGTTLIACEQLGRKCCTMEIDPKYVQLIIDRWESFTGKRAVKCCDS